VFQSRTLVRRCLLIAAASVAIVGTTGGVLAQTVTDPTTVEFDPSPDHWSVDSNGQPTVDHYALTIFAAGSTTPYEVAGLGKPTPDADGKIRVSLSSVLSTWPLPLLIYTAQVAAIGPDGTAVSSVSNAFTFSGPCSYAVAIDKQTFTASGGTGTVSVIVGGGCTWSAGTAAGWISMGSTGGSGTGSVGFGVASNSSSLGRSGYVNVAGQSFAISEAGAPCTFSLSPASQSFTASGGTGSTTVTTPAGCTWTAVSTVSWLTASSGATGSGTVGYTVAVNASASSRTGALSVGGALLTVSQGGACSYAISPTSKSVGSGNASASVSVTTSAGCPWTASSNASWITVNTRSGTGSGTVSLSVAKNPARPQRIGTVTIAGQSFTVTQQ